MVRKNFKMFVPRYRTISINGAVLDVDISHDEFVDELIEWVESKGWAFLGLTEEITEEEAKKILMDLFEDEEE
ncbi:hypothetical protein CN326_21085 [Bacillus sp. AFS018417]|uniref:hypothetical protein n=1 Tax=unclassified Bacillus (in: firmicutes) TaxID=185979 RepID=UPI000BF96569|nr:MULTISPECIES: hypothetical protein [unclassified Bacillus (in: firmicutes)]MCP1122947.1 hypothetical protein [Bacillus sp. 3103sda1]PEZ01628.1 hypothetical protein CN326_21085 [Bacillus sp. AFS018417]